MRKLILLIAILFLAACTSDNISSDADVIVDETTLAKFEQDFLQMMSDRSFIYDLKIQNDDIQQVAVRVDYYEDGELKERIVDFSTDLSEPSKKTNVAFIQQIFQETYEKWSVVTFEDNGYGAAETENEFPKTRDAMMSTMWGSVGMPIALMKDEPEVIAHIIYSNESVVSSSAYVETEEDLRELTKYEHVYVLSLEVK